MRKFTTIFVAVVLCLAAFAVCASAKNTNCTATSSGTHDWTAWKTVQILEDGTLVEERTCACGKSEQQFITPHKYHEVEEIPAVAPTCTETGLTAGSKCVTCDEIIVAQEEIAALGHTEEEIAAVEATCLDAGLTAGSKCSVCGEIIVAQEEIAPIAHTVEYVAEATAICGSGEDGNIEYWYCTVCGFAWLDEACTLNTNLLSVVVPAAAEHTVEHVEAKTVVCGDAENGNIEYWYCTTCGFAWLDEACTLNTNLLSVVVPAAAEHTVEHVEAKDPTATEQGNLEYWYCTTCGFAWLDEARTLNTNLLSVVLPALSEQHTIVHVEAKEATCFELGNIEYWYCTTCGYAWLDEACILNTNLHAVNLPLAHEVEHVEAKEATCFELGNIEYWYCTKCGYAWLDEACTLNTNLQAVNLPLAHKVEHVEAKEPTATENGNIEYWYCTECGYAWLDSFCTLNTNLKAVVLPATGETPSTPEAPDTGDNAIFVIVAIVAVATLGVAAVSFKKREN